jgi:pimeloyl-ACP methyl ester carboxylesterase
VPYEPPLDAAAARRTRIWRWVSLLLVALLVGLLAYLGWIGYDGSGQLVEPRPPSADCRTPASAFDWDYEAINYDGRADQELVQVADPLNCPAQGPAAGAELTTADGTRIAGWYVPAARSIGPRGPTVVLAHGSGSNKSGMLAFAEPLHRDFNLVLFDFRNHGQSSGAQTTAGVLEQDDLRAVIDWLVIAKRPSAIAVLGVSMGAAAAVNEADSDPRVIALILDSTHATLANALQARLQQGGYPLALPGAWSILLGGLIRTGQDMSAVDPVQAIARYGERPVLIIVGGQDDAIGSTDATDLRDAAEAGGSEAELKTCADAEHGGAIVTCAAEYREWVLGFLRRSFAAAS